MSKKRILLFSHHQFGQLVDTIKYCEYAKDHFEITYIGWDFNVPKIKMDGVTIKYVERSGNLIKRNVLLLIALHKEIQSGNYSVVFMHYSRGISFVRLFNLRHKMVFDVRTLSVNRNALKRVLYNFFLKLESLFFKKHSIISDGIARQLKISNYNLLPLGGDRIARSEVTTTKLNLLYVGTLQNRDIIKCVKGMHKYLLKYNDFNIKMSLIGDSAGTELEEIRSYIETYPVLKGIVFCLGRIPHGELSGHFNEANVGISFIPITKWFDHQPPTKTYEYLLAGLPVIATKTYENSKLLKNEKMALLIDDTEDDFCFAIENSKSLMRGIKPNLLADRYKVYSWENIVQSNFLKIIDEAAIDA